MFNTGVRAQSWAAYFLSLSFDAMLRELQIVYWRILMCAKKKHLQITFVGYMQCPAGLVMNDILISRLDMANSELNESCRAWQLRRPWRYASN